MSSTAKISQTSSLETSTLIARARDHTSLSTGARLPYRLPQHALTSVQDTEDRSESRLTSFWIRTITA